MVMVIVLTMMIAVNTVVLVAPDQQSLMTINDKISGWICEKKETRHVNVCVWRRQCVQQVLTEGCASLPCGDPALHSSMVDWLLQTCNICCLAQFVSGS